MSTTPVYGAVSNESVHHWNISENDLKHARSANYGANRNKWKDALIHAGRAKDPIIKKIFIWRKLISKSKDITFDEITSFITENPNWPYDAALRKKAEKISDKNVKPEKIVEWFAKSKAHNGLISIRNPLTSKGKIALAEAAIVLKGKAFITESEINRLIREAWVERDFLTPEKEKSFLDTYKNRLRNKDHRERIDRLIWANLIKPAKRILYLIDYGYQKLFEARIKLKNHRIGLDAAIRAIPQHLKENSGLIYDRLMWRKRYGKAGSASNTMKLIRKLPLLPEKPKTWWRIKTSYIWDFIKEKEYKDAYELAKNHGFSPDGKNKNLAKFAEGEWLAGWISLRFLKDAREAYKHFFRIYHEVKSPTSLARAAYWSGRAAESNLNFNLAQKWYGVASEYSISFYGQLASEKLDDKNERGLLHLPVEPISSEDDIKKYQKNSFVNVAYILRRLGKHSMARQFLKGAIKSTATSGEKLLIAEFGAVLNRKDYGVTAAKEASRKDMNGKNTILIKHLFPILSDTKDIRGREYPSQATMLAHSVMRQESGFDRVAVSPAGALGLMQLMPATAKETARKMRLPYDKKRLTSDSRYNITLGTKYLERMIQRYNGSYILGIAAYNGGGGNVNKWIRANGNPQHFTSVEEIIDWIEMIPFPETRNYVQRVIENLQLYRYLLDKKRKPIVEITQDLTR